MTTPGLSDHGPDLGISLLEATAFAASDELIALGAKIQRLLGRALKRRRVGHTPIFRLAALAIKRDTQFVSRFPPTRPGTRKRLRTKVEDGRVLWDSFAYRVRSTTVYSDGRKRFDIHFMVVLLVEFRGRTVVGVGRIAEYSRLASKTIAVAWPELGETSSAHLGHRLVRWWKRAHNDRIAAKSAHLRNWAELTLFTRPKSQAGASRGRGA